jgi:hypothetical protein
VGLVATVATRRRCPEVDPHIPSRERWLHRPAGAVGENDAGFVAGIETARVGRAHSQPRTRHPGVPHRGSKIVGKSSRTIGAGVDHRAVASIARGCYQNVRQRCQHLRTAVTLSTTVPLTTVPLTTVLSTSLSVGEQIVIGRDTKQVVASGHTSRVHLRSDY